MELEGISRRTFKLSDKFMEDYVGKQPAWGPLGYIIYKRCVTIDTPVLTRDLRWIPAGDLKEGDELLSFDEHGEKTSTGYDGRRKFRNAVVTHNSIEEADCVEILLSDGTKLTATEDHPWLVRKKSSKLQWVESNQLLWRRTSDCLFPKYFDLWEEDTSYDGGYLAAAFDGEGSLDRHRALSFTQVDNEMLANVERLLTKYGFVYKKNPKTRTSVASKQCYVLHIYGTDQVARFLGMFRPKRLLQKFLDSSDDMALKHQRVCHQEWGDIHVVSVTPVGKRQVAVLSTSTHTHFTAGFASHNTYSRFLDETGQKTEEFWQTLQRVIEGTFNIQKFHCFKHNIPWDSTKAQKQAQRMFEKMWNFKFLPSGRGLWLMGTDFVYKHGSAGLNSCAFTSTEDINNFPSAPFVLAMNFLMIGVVVGHDVRGAGKLKIKNPKPDGIFVVEDSREGWIKSVEVLLDSYFLGQPVSEFDYSQIRPAGELLKHFGGKAAGPQPLIDLHNNIHKILKNREGDYLTSTDIVDLFTCIAQCVVAGNIRRSAMISIGDYEDAEFMDIKKNITEDTKNRYACNQSVFARVGMDYTEIVNRAAIDGEPGIVWMDTVRNYGRLIDPPNDKDRRSVGVNPCGEISCEDTELCLSGDTRILTQDGYRFIRDLSEQSVYVATAFTNDSCFLPRPAFAKANIFSTGIKQTLRITTLDGRNLVCTPNHPILSKRGKSKYSWVPAEKLQQGDKLVVGKGEITTTLPTVDSRFYALGHFLGAGWLLEKNNKRSLGICAGQHERFLLETVLPEWEKVVVEAENYIQNNYDNRYTQPLKIREDHNKVLTICVSKPHVFRTLVEKYGFTPNPGPKKRLPGSYWTATADQKRSFLRGLFDADGTVVNRARKSIGLTTANKELARDVLLALSEFGITARMTTQYLADRNRYQTILQVRGYEDLDRFRKHILFVSDSFHSTKAEQLEMCLSNFRTQTHAGETCIVASIEQGSVEAVYNLEVENAHHFIAEGLIVHNCNLSETFPANHDNYEEFEETLKYAVLYCKIVSLLDTPWPKTNAVIRRNRRMGVSQSGIQEAIAKFGRNTMREWCEKGYQFMRLYDRKISDFLGVRESNKISTTKPSGSISLLPGFSPGIHYPHSEYYIRRVRFAKNSNLIASLVAAGYPVEDDVVSPDTTVVVSFPIKTKNFSKSKEKVSVWQQLENAAMYQKYWADNQVSITVTFKPEEKDDLVEALSCYEDKLKVVSLLPLRDHGYQQAPYEEITKEQYEEMIKSIREIDYSSVNGDKAAGEQYCSNDSCTLSF